MLDSTLLISEGPKPVAVRLCLGLVNSGPTGPLSSEMGALVEGRLSRVEVEVAIDSEVACVVVDEFEHLGQGAAKSRENSVRKSSVEL